jgi:hypothetical protein
VRERIQATQDFQSERVTGRKDFREYEWELEPCRAGDFRVPGALPPCRRPGNIFTGRGPAVHPLYGPSRHCQHDDRPRPCAWFIKAIRRLPQYTLALHVRCHSPIFATILAAQFSMLNCSHSVVSNGTRTFVCLDTVHTYPIKFRACQTVSCLRYDD